LCNPTAEIHPDYGEETDDRRSVDVPPRVDVCDLVFFQSQDAFT
jgi:hypothetical protein